MFTDSEIMQGLIEDKYKNIDVEDKWEQAEKALVDEITKLINKNILNELNKIYNKK